MVVIPGLRLLSGFSLAPGKTVKAGSLWGYVTATGAVGALSIVAAAIATRARAIVTVISRSIMAAVISVIVFGGSSVQAHDDAQVPTVEDACHDTRSVPWCNG